ncbi:MAG: glycosyltransferase [Chitinophagales bacterium]
MVKDKEPFFYKIIRVFQLLLNFLLTKLGNGPTKKQRSHFRHILKRYKINIIHTPYQQLLKDNAMKCPSITTLHDVQELHFPQYFSPEQRAQRAVDNAYNVKNADTVIVSYNHVKNDIIKFFKRDEKSIKVVLLNMGKLWFEKYTKSDVLKTINDIKISEEKYLFYPCSNMGTQKPCITLKSN